MSNVNPLIEWAISKGLEMNPGITVKFIESCGNGVYTTRKVEPYEELMRIPHEMKINPINVLKYSELGNLLLKIRFSLESVENSETVFNFEPNEKNNGDNIGVKLSGEELMIGFLVYERNLEYSRWNEYLKSLPRNIPAAFLWDSKEIEKYLGETGLDAYIEMRKEKLKKSIDRINYLFELLDLNTSDIREEDYYWAYCVIKSRAYCPLNPSSGGREITLGDIELNEDQTRVLESVSNSCAHLLPLLDCFNHKPATPIEWIIEEDGIVFKSPVEIEECQQVFNNYGPKSNEELLLFYGFTCCCGCSIQKGYLDYVRLTLKGGTEGNHLSLQTVYLKHDMKALKNLVEVVLSEVLQDSSLQGQIDSRMILLELIENKIDKLTTKIESCQTENHQNATNAFNYLMNQKTILLRASEVLNEEIDALEEPEEIYC